MNPNWPRWIHASICKMFTDYAKKVGFILDVEAQSKKNSNDQDWAELRVNGPSIKEQTKGVFILDIEVNTLISSILERTDSHQHKKIVGLVQSGYIDCFPVYRFGDSDVDTQDVLGYFQFRKEDKEGVNITYFGQIDPDIILEQSSIDARYRMILSTK